MRIRAPNLVSKLEYRAVDALRHQSSTSWGWNRCTTQTPGLVQMQSRNTAGVLLNSTNFSLREHFGGEEADGASLPRVFCETLLRSPTPKTVLRHFGPRFF